MTDIFTSTFLTGLAAATVLIATPYLIAALGETISERGGVLNVGLDGYMLVGAFGGFAASYYSGSAWVGVLGGIAAGAAIAAVAGLLIVYLNVDQIVVGVAMLILGLGATSAIYQLIFRVEFGGGAQARVAAPSLGIVSVPGLRNIPFFGDVLFQQVPLTWLAAALVPLVWFGLYKTRAGLAMRAAGAQPEALEAMGGNVRILRFVGVLCAGGFAGLAGAFLSIGQASHFFDNMTAGAGFIVLGIVIFGRRHPIGVLLAALLFAFVDAFQTRLQTINVDIPFQLLLMLPYIVTILVLVRAPGRAGAPAALGERFIPAQRA